MAENSGNGENSSSSATALEVNGNLFAKNLQRRDGINNALRRVQVERRRQKESEEVSGTRKWQIVRRSDKRWSL